MRCPPFPLTVLPFLALALVGCNGANNPSARGSRAAARPGSTAENQVVLKVAGMH
jgi:hypothetical protein